MARRFTHSEAEQLIPEVDRLIREAVQFKAGFDEAETGLQEFTQRVMLMGGVVVDRTRVLEQRAARDQAAEKLKATIEHIHEHGCVVKDLDIGLVDFPTLFRGQEVYLCWKMGEDAIRFWHGTDEGFAGRKPIDDDFLHNHRGDLTN